MILDRADSFLLLIDLQERLVPAVREPRRLVGNCLRLMHAAEMLEVPLFLTEHCADKIGPVVEEIRTRVEETQVLQKRSFSTLREPRCRERLEGLGRLSPVIAGTEAHVCVLQTALDLKAAGYAPRYVVDAVSTRKESDLTTAVARAEANGIEVMSVEMVLFEWLGRGDDPDFGSVLELIKSDL
jgi:nicotinamidase-related amidase